MGAPSKAESILALWDSGERDKAAIRDQLKACPSYIDQVLRDRARAERGEARARKHPPPRPPRPAPRTCQRPDVGNGLKPCGRPLHKIGGETLGVCQHHWEIGKPVPGQQRRVSDRW